MPLLELNSGIYGTAVEKFLTKHAGNPNIAIRGKGAGQTFIECPVFIDGPRPELQDLTIAPVDSGVTCLDMHNTSEHYVRNVRINVPENGLGINLEINHSARNGKHRFAHSGKETSGAFSTCSVFDSVHVLGNDVQGSRGWNFNSDFEWWVEREGFFNHLRILNGHTMVEAEAMVMDRIRHIAITGHHIDAQPYGGIHLGADCENINWNCPGYIEAGYTARSNYLPVITGRHSQLNVTGRILPEWYYG